VEYLDLKDLAEGIARGGGMVLCQQVEMPAIA
jgi:hypothetical protein